MTLKRLPPALLAAASLTLTIPLRAQATDPDPDLRELLRDALYTEEVTRDPEAAAKQYEALLSKHDAQRAFAASALFRLAEVRRKQDRKDEAIALYQRLLREFPAAEAEGKLARENLAAMGAKVEAQGSPADDEEAIELKRLQQWVKSSPDRLKDPELVLDAVEKGQLRSIEFLLKAGAAAEEPWKLLREAVTTGNLRTTTLLLDFPFKAGYRGVDDALFTAVTLEYQDIAKLLLSRGADPHRQDWYRIDENVTPPSSKKAKMTALHVAVRKRNIALCKLLLDHKADPNRFAEKPSIPTKDSRLPDLPAGSPLHDAVVSSLEITRMLIDHGADINAAHNSTGITPLFVALKLSEPAETIGFLIEKGATLEAASTAAAADDSRRLSPGSVGSPTPPPPSRLPAGSTPLRFALEWRKVPAALQLLQAGASAKHPGILSSAVRTLDPELVREVLAQDAHLADPDADPIREVATQASEKDSRAIEPILNLLLDKGIKPRPDWVERYFEGAPLSIRPLLYQRFLVPALQEKPAITAIFPFAGSLRPVELSAGGSGAPAAFEDLLINRAIRWPCVSIDHHNHFPTRFTLWRRSAEAVHGQLDGNGPLPGLQWGDVLEFSPDWEKMVSKPDNYNISYYDGLPDKTMWHVRKRIAFPVTVELDGVSRDLTLRGDRLIFDPGSDQVPLVGASRLASLLWQPEFFLNDVQKPELSVVRGGWPDVSVPWNSDSNADFPLKSGDRLVIKAPPPPDDLIDRRKQHVVVKCRQLPFVRIYGVPDAPSNPYPASLPTLIQALADVGSYNISSLRSAPADPAALPVSLMGSRELPILLLPHPDYSKIVIRRLDADGKEKTIAVDLATVIANSTADTTPEEARQADVTLQAGDIVEIPQLPGLAGTPWKGFTDAEGRFFAKALDCKVQVIFNEGGIDLREIRYQVPRFIEVAGQAIPLPPLSGVDTLKASIALDQEWDIVEVTRPGVKASIVASRAFLRDGDVITVGTRPPRPRVLPPQPNPQLTPSR
jgi:tetratricopeptide (TPR) repeat protein